MSEYTEGITINTHSSIRIAGSAVLYFDPFRIEEEKHDADLIFVTHSHFDHLDPDSIGKIRKKTTVFVAPANIRADLEKVSDGAGTVYVEPGDETECGGIHICAVPAYNKLKPFHPKRNGWVGYLVKMDGISYYVAGDTDAVKELEELSCDVAMVPIGGTYTMTAKEAAGLVNKIHPAVAVPTHYGSVVGKGEDAQNFKKAVKEGILTEILLSE